MSPCVQIKPGLEEQLDVYFLYQSLSSGAVSVKARPSEFHLCFLLIVPANEDVEETTYACVATNYCVNLISICQMVKRKSSRWCGRRIKWDNVEIWLAQSYLYLFSFVFRAFKGKR